MEFININNLYIPFYDSEKIYKQIFPLINKKLKNYPYYELWIKKDYKSFHNKIILLIEKNNFLHNKLYTYNFYQDLHNLFEKYKNLINIPPKLLDNLDRLKKIEDIKNYTNFNINRMYKWSNHTFFSICSNYDLCKHVIKNDKKSIQCVISKLEIYSSNYEKGEEITWDLLSLYERYNHLYNKCEKIISYLFKKGYSPNFCAISYNLNEHYYSYSNYNNHFMKKCNNFILYGFKLYFIPKILNNFVNNKQSLFSFLDIYTREFFFKIMINADYSSLEIKKINILLNHLKEIDNYESKEIVKWIENIYKK